jgi:hypothetical protein
MDRLLDKTTKPGYVVMSLHSVQNCNDILLGLDDVAPKTVHWTQNLVSLITRLICCLC